MSERVTIATRGSRLALWQAEHVRDRLMAAHPGLEVELRIIKTQGDVILDVPLAKVGGKGLFVKEIEETLLSGSADLAVHSMKDVPVLLPPGLMLGAVPEREDPADLFLSHKHDGLDALPAGALVGTSSLRRQAQILAIRPELKVQSVRGNVETRLRKLEQGDFDAIVMAAAGMKRLGLETPHMARLEPPRFLPAVGQGALGIECREADERTRALIACLEHTPTRICVEAERGFLTGLDGGCQVPIAAHAEIADGLRLDGLVAAVDGSRHIRQEICLDDGQPLSPQSARELGLSLARHVLDAGAAELLASVY